MSVVEELKAYLKRRIDFAEKRAVEIIEYHGEHPDKNFSYHGGRSKGYWEGLAAGYQNSLDELDEILETEREEGEFQQLQKDVEFFQKKQEVTKQITQELVALNDSRVKEILMKTRTL